MAKKRTKDQDGRRPYDHQEAKRWVEAAAEAVRVKRWNLTHCAMCVYGRTLDGFADRIAATHTSNHQDAGVRRVLDAGHQQWTRQTGLPPLDSDDHWRIVAVAAGAGDESLGAIEDGDRKGLDLLVRRLVAWCKTRVTGAPTAPTGEPLTDTEQAVFDVIQSEGPVTGKRICNTVGIDQGTLTSRIIPVLNQRRGVRNKRGAGYYVP